MVAEVVPYEFPRVGTMRVIEMPGRGPAAEFTFPNGYGASVITDGNGGASGLYELAPLDADGNIVHLPEITGPYDSVAGWLNGAEVAEKLRTIASL